LIRSGGRERIVLVTAGSMAEAQRVARSVVLKQLAACVNVVHSPVESVYQWKGRVERAREYLMIMKTTSARLEALEREVSRLHHYKVPEFVVLRIAGGSKKYLEWIRESTVAK